MQVTFHTEQGCSFAQGMEKTKMNQEFVKAYLKTKKMNCWRCGGLVDAWKYSVNGGVCDKCKGEVRWEENMKVVLYPKPIKGTHTYQGHYFCAKCGEMMGFPHPNREVNGIWKWNKDATRIVRSKHKCVKKEK